MAVPDESNRYDNPSESSGTRVAYSSRVLLNLNGPVLSEDSPEGSLKGLLPLFRARPTQAQTDSSQTDSRHHGLHGGLDQDGLEAGNANGGIRIFEAMAGHGGRHQ